MKLIQLMRKNKKAFLPAIFIVAVLFIYGCRCEGGIDAAADSVDTVKIVSIQPENQ
ncbi:MAG: hypothetical protein RIG61_02080 [Deltaproteobacteria bacterium]